MFSQPLQQLQQDLASSSQYWQFVPFKQQHYPWHQHNPALSQALDELTAKQLATLEHDPQSAREALAPFLPPLPLLPHERGNHADEPEDTFPFWLSTGVKGRKWQQIRAFCQHITPAGEHFIEWCAGKGHLGRALGWQYQRRVTSLEWQASLCQSGQQQSEQHHIDQQFVQCDVLKDDTRPYLTPSSHAVALHACGDLHTTLLRKSVQSKVASVHLSPCCYHLTADRIYQPLSQVAQQHSLPLDRNDLRLAVQETVTAGNRDIRKRQQEKFSRILFDLWQRQVREQDSYLPVPSAPDAIIRQGTREFCLWAASKKGLSTPDKDDLDRLTPRATERYDKLARMELVQHLYRRPLEYYLVLDRCQYLAEAGFDVALTTFCERQVTPRNLLITATLRAS